MNEARQNFLDKLIGAAKAKEVIEDVEEAARELDKNGVERKAKKEDSEKQGPLVPAEVIAEAIIKALADAGVELAEDTIKLVISTAMEAAGKIDEATAPVAEVVEEEVAVAEPPSEEMQEDEEEDMPSEEMQEDEEEDEEAKRRFEKALKGFADIVEDVGDIGKGQLEMAEALKALTDIVKQTIEKVDNVEALVNSTPSQASRSERTQVRDDEDGNLTQKMQEAMSDSDSTFLDIPLARK